MKEKKETISFIGGEVKVKPINNGTLIFKQHHMMYCECLSKKGKLREVWTDGKRKTCCAKLGLNSEENDKKIFKCSKSGFTIILLKSSKKEFTTPDEMGNIFIKLFLSSSPLLKLFK